MAVLIGYDVYGKSLFSDDSPSLRTIKYTEFAGAIIDDIALRTKTNQGTTNVKDTWQNDSILIANFLNNLDAGNISNDGVKIVKFKIVRRLATQDQFDDIQLGEVPFSGGNGNLSFEDVSNPNQNLIYTIIPVGENDLDGTPREVEVEGSDFVGYWLVDRDTKDVLAFDKVLGSIGNVDTTLVQNRTLLETFNKYNQVYYGNAEYHTFTLNATFLPEEWERSGDVYLKVLNSFVKQHKPFVCKAANGMMYVVDVSNVRTSSPMNTWSDYDPITISLDCTEVQGYEEFLKGE